MFITFEGIDGSGKSTQIQLLKEKLTQQGQTVRVFRDPGGTDTSERIRELLLNANFDIYPVTELLLFSSARAQLISEKVKPMLAKNNVVILDRYYDSTIAYQGYGRSSLPLPDIHKLNEIAAHQTVPDVTFYLKISLDESERRTTKMAKDRMEQSGKQFYEKVIEGFNTLAQNEQRIITVDAENEESVIHRQIWQQMQRKFPDL